MTERELQYKENRGRRIVEKLEYSTIYDPRLNNYPEGHRLFLLLAPRCADQGVGWILVANNMLKEVEDILDSYPEKPVSQENEEI